MCSLAIRLARVLDQTKSFAVKPEENVGVRLTSGFLLEPEQSTSAIVVHHPAAKYFVV
jgi:5-methyltetrahydrofolate--homocysteine methyltransferase